MSGPKLELEEICFNCNQHHRLNHFPPKLPPFCDHHNHHPDDQEHLSRCSASCGGGERMVEHLCKDSQTERVVNDGLCDLQVI